MIMLSAVAAARQILTSLHEVMASRAGAQAKLNQIVEVIGENLDSEVCSIYLLREGIAALPCIGDGRQSGTSASPSILNASPEAAAGGGLALLQSGDRRRIDLRQGTVDVLIDEAELATRRAALEAAGGYPYPASQTPWQAIQRSLVGQLETGAILEGAESFQRIAQTRGLPRDNH